MCIRDRSYTAILNMLDLAGVPVRSKDRTALAPMVVAGGPCACNPEPVADFIDIFIIGEGEEVNIELTDLYMQAKKEGWDKQRFLQQAAQIGGVYVPSLYDVSYREDGTIDSVKPNCPQAPEKVTKRIIADLDKVYYPKQFVVPFINIVHDRSMLEIQRGCLRGCRFCQAGFIYRPLRDKHYDTLNADAHSLCDTSGYEELSPVSYTHLDVYKRQLHLLAARDCHFLCGVTAQLDGNAGTADDVARAGCGVYRCKARLTDRNDRIIVGVNSCLLYTSQR